MNKLKKIFTLKFFSAFSFEYSDWEKFDQYLYFLDFIYYQTFKSYSFFYGFSQSDKTGFSVLVSRIDKVAVFPHKYITLKKLMILIHWTNFENIGFWPYFLFHFFNVTPCKVIRQVLGVNKIWILKKNYHSISASCTYMKIKYLGPLRL